MAGKALGMVGLGRTGEAVARRALPFEVNLIACERVEGRRTAGRALGVRFMDLDGLLATADIVSLHLPLMPETRHLMDARAPRRMKPTAIPFDTTRGGPVDEEALVEALTCRRLRGAGLDMFEREPLPADHPLLGLPNVVLTPHISAGTMLHTETEDGKDVLTFLPFREYPSVTFSCSEFEKQTTFVIHTDGSSTGAALDGVCPDGDYACGSALETVTISDVVACVGAYSGGFLGGPGGGPPEGIVNRVDRVEPVAWRSQGWDLPSLLLNPGPRRAAPVASATAGSQGPPSTCALGRRASLCNKHSHQRIWDAVQGDAPGCYTTP